jgi:hypothetical protein
MKPVQWVYQETGSSPGPVLYLEIGLGFGVKPIFDVAYMRAGKRLIYLCINTTLKSKE